MKYTPETVACTEISLTRVIRNNCSSESMTKGAGEIDEVCVCLISPINLRKFSASRSTRLLLVDDNVNLHGNGSRLPRFHWVVEGDVLQLIYFGRTCEELGTR